MTSGDLSSLPPCLRSSRLLITDGHIEYALILTDTRPCPLLWVRPTRPPCCLLWLCSYLSCLWSTPNTPSQVWLCGYLIHPWSTPTTPTHPSASCRYVATSLIPGECPPRPPFYQLWLRGYLTNPWSMHTTSSQVWLCGYVPYPLSTPTLCQRRLRSYLSYPWSTPILLPAATTRLLTCPRTTPTTPSQPQAWWIYVAISLFTSWDSAASFHTTGVRPSHTALPPAVVAVHPSLALS